MEAEMNSEMAYYAHAILKQKPLLASLWITVCFSINVE